MLSDLFKTGKNAQEFGSGGPGQLSFELRNLLAACVLLAAAGGAVYAQHAERPISAAIVFIFGVTLVGAMIGLKGGLIAALIASVIYNFFLSDPVYRFSLASIDELAPLLAFNLSAAASGLVAGRLRDRASAAESANQRIKRLLETSERLQHAVKLDQIVPALAASPPMARKVELYAIRVGRLEEVAESCEYRDVADDLLNSGRHRLECRGAQAFLLAPSSQAIGILVIAILDPSLARVDRDQEALVSLVTIAMQRCLLHEQLSDAELIRRSEEFKTTLLSSVSHDMRTPLSAISASASSLSRYGDDLTRETRDDLLKMIGEQCDRLNRYTANLLSLGRLQSGLDPDAFLPCDALEALGRAITRAREAGARNIVKEFETGDSIVRADPVMLEQIFYNVLENSVRYGSAAGPITVRALSESGVLKVAISDQGPGIPDDEIQHVFNRFYRAKSVSAVEGSGLGLSIAKGFTEAFGGQIAAQSRSSGRGTTIIVSLPLQHQGRPS